MSGLSNVGYCISFGDSDVIIKKKNPLTVWDYVYLNLWCFHLPNSASLPVLLHPISPDTLFTLSIASLPPKLLLLLSLIDVIIECDLLRKSSVDFPATYQDWTTTDPLDLFEAPIRKTETNPKVSLSAELQILLLLWILIYPSISVAHKAGLATDLWLQIKKLLLKKKIFPVDP